MLASQVRQVLYLEDPNEKSWQVIFRVVPRDLYNILTANINHQLQLFPNWNVHETVLDDNEVN